MSIPPFSLLKVFKIVNDKQMTDNLLKHEPFRQLIHRRIDHTKHLVYNNFEISCRVFLGLSVSTIRS